MSETICQVCGLEEGRVAEIEGERIVCECGNLYVPRGTPQDVVVEGELIGQEELTNGSVKPLIRCTES